MEPGNEAISHASTDVAQGESALRRWPEVVDKLGTWLGTVVAVLVSIIALYFSCGTRTKERSDIEDAALSEFREGGMQNPIEGLPTTSLLQFVSDNGALLDDLLRKGPKDEAKGEGPEFLSLAREAGLKLRQAAIRGDDQIIDACRARLAFYHRLGMKLREGLVRPESVRGNIAGPFSEFVANELSTCRVLLERSYANRAVFLGGYYRTKTAPESLYGRSPYRALESSSSWTGISHVVEVLDVKPHNSYLPPIPEGALSIAQVGWSGCNGALRNIVIEGDKALVRGRLAFEFFPGWSGGPGEELYCAYLKEADDSRPLNLRFLADGTTVAQFERAPFGSVSASVPGAAIGWGGSHKQIVVAWDFSQMEPKKFLSLHVAGVASSGEIVGADPLIDFRRPDR